MKRTSLFAGLMLLATSTAVQASDAVRNWAAPSTWTPPSARAAGRSALAVFPPLPFVPLAPCRLIDTRTGSGFPAGYGSPSIPANTQRTFTITGQCGIPVGAQAVSFNFAVWIPASRGDLRVFPAGGATPTVSTLNWEAGILALANAAVTPLGAGGAITVQMDASTATDIFVDVNGYCTQAPSTGFAVVTPGFFGLYGAGTSIGVAGFSSAGVGVQGISTASRGVEGFSAGAGSAGVSGTNTSNADFSKGVDGFEGGSGTVFGVQGAIGATAGVGSAGVHGLGAATATVSNGVLGESFTSVSNSAGVRGIDRTAANIGSSFYVPAGVRGESNVAGIGVFGVSNNLGVVGIKHNAAGVHLSEGYVGFSSGATNYAFFGAVGDYGGSGAKYFVEPYPLDASKVIRYISLEGPESGTYFRGQAQTSGGLAVIHVPEHFRMVSDTEGITVHLTPVGHFAQTWVESSDLNEIVIRSSRDVTFNYIVHGVRRAFKDFKPIGPGEEFVPRTWQETLSPGLPAEIRARLIAMGIYNPDGTVNMQTADRMGWVERWRHDEAGARAAREEAAAKGK